VPDAPTLAAAFHATSPSVRQIDFAGAPFVSSCRGRDSSSRSGVCDRHLRDRLLAYYRGSIPVNDQRPIDNASPSTSTYRLRLVIVAISFIHAHDAPWRTLCFCNHKRPLAVFDVLFEASSRVEAFWVSCSIVQGGVPGAWMQRAKRKAGASPSFESR